VLYAAPLSVDTVDSCAASTSGSAMRRSKRQAAVLCRLLQKFQKCRSNQLCIQHGIIYF
jgi:hypothetical protein